MKGVYIKCVLPYTVEVPLVIAVVYLMVFCSFVFSSHECLGNEGKAAQKKDEVKSGFDELHKQLVDCTGNTPPVIKFCWIG